MVNKLIHSLILVLCFMIFLSSCGYPHLSELKNTETETETVTEMGYKAIDAIVENDIEQLKSIMSERAINSTDFYDGFEYASNLLTKSKIISIEERGCSISGGYGGGGKYKRGRMTFILSLEDGSELGFWFVHYLYNKRDSSTVGLDYIEIYDRNIDYGNEESSYYSDEFGIYIPRKTGD